MLTIVIAQASRLEHSPCPTMFQIIISFSSLSVALVILSLRGTSDGCDLVCDVVR